MWATLAKRMKCDLMSFVCKMYSTSDDMDTVGQSATPILVTVRTDCSCS